MDLPAVCRNYDDGTVHTIFNIGITVLLFPASDLIIKLAKKLEREDEKDNDESRVLLDALVCLERISDHSRNIAEEILMN